MKRLLLSIVLLILTITGGSQTVTEVVVKSNDTSDSCICITPTQLRLIRLELTELDFIKDTLVVHQRKDSLIQIKVNQLESIVVIQDSVIATKDKLIDSKNEEIEVVKGWVEEEKKKHTKTKIAVAGLIVLQILFLAVAI